MREHETLPSRSERERSVDKLTNDVAEKLERAEVLGIESRVLIVAEDGKEIISKQADQPLFAASVNKLAVARTIEDLASEQYMQNVIDLKNVRLAQGPGGGAFETTDRPHTATVVELYEDMLVRSGNSSTIALVDWLGGPEVVNEYMEELGFAVTKLDIQPNGTFYMGDTTPQEVVRLLRGSDPQVDLPFSIGQLLAKNQEVDGIKKFIPTALQVANKSGALKNDPDGDFCHDTGWIINPKTNEALLFAIMFHMPKDDLRRPLRRIEAKNIIAQIGADLAEAIGDQHIKRSRRFREHLMQTAFRFRS